MADSVRLYIASETADDDDVVELHGPAAGGGVDWSAPLPGARRLVRRGPIGRGHNAPAGLGPAGLETNWTVIASEGLVFGLKQFGVKRYAPDGRVSGTTPETAAVFVNAAPLPSSELRAVEQPVGGCLKFTFVPGIFE